VNTQIADTTAEPHGLEAQQAQTRASHGRWADSDRHVAAARDLRDGFPLSASCAHAHKHRGEDEGQR